MFWFFKNRAINLSFKDFCRSICIVYSLAGQTENYTSELRVQICVFKSSAGASKFIEIGFKQTSQVKLVHCTGKDASIKL